MHGHEDPAPLHCVLFVGGHALAADLSGSRPRRYGNGCGGNRWLATLTPSKRRRANSSSRAINARTFITFRASPSNQKGKRFGLPMKEMTPQQRALTQALLSVGPESEGTPASQHHPALEKVLYDLEKQSPMRDPEMYHVSIFGTPSDKTSWAWRFEGIMSLSHSLWSKAHLFSVTPSFFGSNPGEVRQGPLTGPARARG
jgi:hypothetical protein